ncbi:MAG: beta-ketoacyl-ACP synthase II [Selenomonadaceae bacterium]|nr:beta-ketoacyl-ACP synthase II [Selenomonadaceae bacterium]
MRQNIYKGGRRHYNCKQRRLVNLIQGNRVVVTGLGVLSPIGTGKENFWAACLAGKNGIGKITRFDPTGYTSQIAGEVLDFDPAQFIDKKEIKRMDRYTQFALAATRLAVDDAQLKNIDSERTGVFVGAGIGGMETLHNQYEKLFTKGASRISPFFIPMMIANMAAGNIAIAFKLQGPCECIVTACASGTNAIGDAYRAIQRGEVDVMFAGGTEAAISPAGVSGFAAMKALCSDHNDDPAHASRPFDKNRSGFVMGEGAGIIVLENLEHAQARGAHIYAELVGYGRNDDAYHITTPAPGGITQAKCMKLALDDAGLKPEEIDYINAHGTSTQFNDRGETEAIKNLFGEHSYKLAVSSTKSMTGHMLGAAGGVEAIATVLSVENDIVHPTINYETPDDGLDLNYVPNTAQTRTVNAAISNSFGFGGHNACLAFKKFVG